MYFLKLCNIKTIVYEKRICQHKFHECQSKLIQGEIAYKKCQKKRQFVTICQILYAFHRVLMPDYCFSIPFGVPSAPQTFGLKWMNQVEHELPCPHPLVWHAVWDAFSHELQTSLSLIQCALLQWGLLVRSKQENKSSMLVKPIRAITTNKSLSNKWQDIQMIPSAALHIHVSVSPNQHHVTLGKHSTWHM
jgi:hypothetical protein